MLSNFWTFSKILLITVYVTELGFSVAVIRCEIPTELRGASWTYQRPGYSSKTVNFGTTVLTSFLLRVQGGDISAYTCVANKDLSTDKTVLIFRSDEEYYDVATSQNRRIYFCMKMTKVSNDLFYFFLLNDLSPSSMRVSPTERVSSYEDEEVTISTDTLESTFCQYDTNNPPDDVRTLQRSGTSETLPAGIRLCEPFENICDSVSVVKCPDIDTVPFSTNTTSGYLVGDTISFNCSEGYEMISGSAELSCADNGTWTGTPPICAIISCPSLPNVQYSTRTPSSPSNTYGETVSYTCNKGHELTAGDQTRTCQANKKWSGSSPTCTIISCPQLETVLNAESNNPVPGIAFGAQIVYTCNTGYERTFGTLVRTCQVDKSWSGGIPVCNRVNCGILSTVPSTSNTKTGTLYSDIITYKCLPGFIHVNGTLSRKCQADKVWDGKPPYCGQTPSSPDALSNMYITVGVASGILLLLPLLVVLLVCYFKDKIFRKNNAKGTLYKQKDRFKGREINGYSDYYSDIDSSMYSFRQERKGPYPVYNTRFPYY